MSVADCNFSSIALSRSRPLFKWSPIILFSTVRFPQLQCCVKLLHVQVFMYKTLRTFSRSVPSIESSMLENEVCVLKASCPETLFVVMIPMPLVTLLPCSVVPKC